LRLASGGLSGFVTGGGWNESKAGRSRIGGAGFFRGGSWSGAGQKGSAIARGKTGQTGGAVVVRARMRLKSPGYWGAGISLKGEPGAQPRLAGPAVLCLTSAAAPQAR
jgi:hypothetical protein